MKFLNLNLIICSLFISACVVSYAQVPIQKSTEKVRIDGKQYYIHYVKKGETLYSLGKAYGVTVQQITDNNPDLAAGLKEGHSIKIPIISETAAGKPQYPSAVNVVHAPAPTQSVLQNNQNNNTAAESKPATVTPQPAPAATTTEPVKPASPGTAPQYHLVKADETIVSITTLYGITEADLKSLNPEAFVNNKLQKGTLLQLPDKKTIAATGQTTEPAAAPTPPAHEGQQEEKKELCDTARFPGADNNVEKQVADSLGTLRKYLDLRADTAAQRNLSEHPLKVALVLPFIRDTQNENNAKVTRTRNPGNFFAFYEGALLAVEKLKQEGLSLQLSVYDSYTREKVDELLAKNELLEQDIVIGPIYADNLQPVAEYGKTHHLKMVSPLDPRAEALTIDNPYFFQLSPPAYCRQKKLIDDVLKQENVNIILIYDKAGKDSLLVESYKELLGDSLANVRFYAHQVQKGIAVRDSLQKRMSAKKRNCVLLASNDEAIISDVAANLYLFTFRNRYQITLYGTERWRNFETVDLKYLHALNLHLVTPFFIDYEAAETRAFITKFYEAYHSEPSQYAFQGYDTFYYFLRAMMLYGKDFEHYLADYHPQLLQAKYNFKYNGSYLNGLVNVESCLINYTPQYKIERR